MSVLFYRRPDYVNRPSGPINKSDCQRYVERTKNSRHNIPDNLSFDNVIEGKSLPPCSLQDYMDYLVYVAHDAENLQFFLWLRDYTRRFFALSPEERALSPEWVATGQDDNDEKGPGPRRRTLDAADIIKNAAAAQDIELASPAMKYEWDEPPKSPNAGMSDFESFIARSVAGQKTIMELVDDANEVAGLKWQGFTVQPFRQEIAKVVAHYLAPNSPRELNISYRDRSAVLHALQHTTHPSAFAPVAELIELTLRGQSHPNFIRWSICNGNKPKIFFVKTMGISHSIAGIVIALILTLSKASRWWRILPAIVTFIGFFTLIAAYKGLCIILHASGKTRNIRPWEEFGDVESKDAHSVNSGDDNGTIVAADSVSGSHKHRSFSTFGITNTTYKDEAWFGKYEKKPLLGKVFEKNTWVREPAVRMIQDRIILQSQLWALMITVVITVVFVAVPAGNLF